MNKKTISGNPEDAERLIREAREKMARGVLQRARQSNDIGDAHLHDIMELESEFERVLAEKAQTIEQRDEAQATIKLDRIKHGLALSESEAREQAAIKERDGLRDVLQEFLGQVNAADYSEMADEKQYEVALTWLKKYDERRDAAKEVAKLIEENRVLREGLDKEKDFAANLLLSNQSCHEFIIELQAKLRVVVEALNKMLGLANNAGSMMKMLSDSECLARIKGLANAALKTLSTGAKEM